MDKTLKYEKGDWKTETVDGVVIEWPFIVEALENAEEVEGGLIQKRMEACFGSAQDLLDIYDSHADLGYAIMHQVKKYISEVKAIREE